MLMYRKRTQNAQKTQKLFIEGIEEVDPARKAKASVIEVIVIEGPAFLMHSLSRLLVGYLSELWSKELHMINISSTPIPIIKIGIASCALDKTHPVFILAPKPANTETTIQISPMIEMLILQ